MDFYGKIVGFKNSRLMLPQVLNITLVKARGLKHQWGHRKDAQSGT